MSCIKLTQVIFLAWLSIANTQSGTGVDDDDREDGDVIYISQIEDLQQLEGIDTLINSLFIHAGTDITTTDLCYLSQLKVISGYLVIWKTPGIKNLKCLRNLTTIQGNELHFGQPPNAVFMEDNVNETSGNGLCFVNTLNWTNITSFSVSITDNGIDCPDCNSQCLSCWGAGPRLCQTCQYYLSGITCVEFCPDGTFINNITNVCHEHSITSQLPALHGTVIDYTHIVLDWTNINQTNGVVLGYQLFMDDNMIWFQQFEDYLPTNDGMVESPPLYTSYDMSGLNFSTTYKFDVKVLTSIGWSNISQSVYLTTDNEIPEPVTDLRVVNVTYETVTIQWNETTPEVNYSVRYRNLTYTNTLATNFTFIEISNLKINETYWVDIQSINMYGISLWSTVNFTTLLTNPPKPNPPYGTKQTCCDIMLELYPVSDIYGYIIYYSLDVMATILENNNTVHVYHSITLDRFTSDFNLNVSDVMDLNHNTTYVFKLTAYITENLSSTSEASKSYNLLDIQDETSGTTNTKFPWWLLVVIGVAGTIIIIVAVLSVIVYKNKKRQQSRRNATQGVVNGYNNAMFTSIDTSNIAYSTHRNPNAIPNNTYQENNNFDSIANATYQPSTQVTTNNKSASDEKLPQPHYSVLNTDNGSGEYGFPPEDESEHTYDHLAPPPKSFLKDPPKIPVRKYNSNYNRIKNNVPQLQPGNMMREHPFTYLKSSNA
jgi:hypothetical protein